MQRRRSSPSRQVRTETTLVVDEIVDETLRMNFNVTLHEARAATTPSRDHTLPPPRPSAATPVAATPAALSATPTRAGAVRVPLCRRVRHDRILDAQHHQGHPQVAARLAPGTPGERAPPRPAVSERHHLLPRGTPPLVSRLRSVCSRTSPPPPRARRRTRRARRRLPRRCLGSTAVSCRAPQPHDVASRIPCRPPRSSTPPSFRTTSPSRETPT